MQDARREILSQVAAGTLTPTEAATRLEEVERGQTETTVAQVAPTLSADIRGISVRSDYGRTIVLGDASVEQAIAEGPHTARVENGLLVIETDQNSDGDFWFGRRNGGRWWDRLSGPTVTVRMNPSLETWITSDAGSVTVRDVRAPIHAEVQAGSLSVERFVGPIDLAASAGSIRAEGRLKEGISRVRCEIGSVRIVLTPDSDVRVTAVAEMGKVSLDGGTVASGRRPSLGQRHEAVYGSGSGSLEIESQMGSVTVSRGQ